MTSRWRAAASGSCSPRMRTSRWRASRLSRLIANGLASEASASPRPPEPSRRLVIGTGGSDLILDVAEIDWIEADDYYAAVHARGRRHLVRESLASLEGRLDRAQF